MSAMLNFNSDRRVTTRANINGAVKYKISNESAYCTGLMVDISQSGLLVNLNEALPVHSQLIVLMESENEDEAPIKIEAEIIRIAESCHDYAYSYGCKIIEVIEV